MSSEASAATASSGCEQKMTTIRRLLVANRGEIAVRVIRTARALDIETVAVFSEPDVDAPFVALADFAVALPGSSAAETYLDQDKIIEIALGHGADAIHPGYGFLSENAGFARACQGAGITFIGPSPEAIDAMGSKIAAKKLMQQAGVPVLPGATLPDGPVADPDLRAIAADVGLPILVKAAFGGGGRGMRVVTELDDLLEAVTSAQREAVSSFGDGTVFLERLVERPRHIEVQILGDSTGNVIHLFERECSIQRRFQKVIEEAPAARVDEELRASLGAAAVAAGKAIGYVGAGTVEFVMDQTGNFYFLEVNTRLQVEHPVTEEVTGLDLVALQIAVAEGGRLPEAALEAQINGHSVEVRLCAEDPSRNYLPSTGELTRFYIPELPGIRVDSGVRAGSIVSSHYDSMLAKVIAWGDTRDEAIRLLARALAEAEIHGLRTNRDLLIAVLRSPEFRDGDFDTGFLGRNEYLQNSGGTEGSARQAHAIAAALAVRARSRENLTALRTLPPGWRNVRTGWQSINLVPELSDDTVEVAYLQDRQGWRGRVGDEEVVALEVYRASPTVVDLGISGLRQRVRVHLSGNRVHCDSSLGHSTFDLEPRFRAPGALESTGSLRAPLPGTVVRVVAERGALLEQGQPILVLEAMKMEHIIRATAHGYLADLRVAVGDTVDSGAVLAVVDPTEEGEG